MVTRYSLLNYVGRKDIDLEKYRIFDSKVYCEPFSGSFNSGIKLLEHLYQGKTVINDLDKNIYNFWKMLKSRPIDLYNQIHVIVSHIRHMEPYEAMANLRHILYVGTDIEKAASQYLILSNRTMMKVHKGDYKVDSEISFEMAGNLVKNSDIENLDFHDCLVKHDSPDTFFLIDPPYSNTSAYYTTNFDLMQLLDDLLTIKGRFLLTFNVDDYLLKTALQRNYFIYTESREFLKGVYKELYITNFEVENSEGIDPEHLDSEAYDEFMSKPDFEKTTQLRVANNLEGNSDFWNTLSWGEP